MKQSTDNITVARRRAVWDMIIPNLEHKLTTLVVSGVVRHMQVYNREFDCFGVWISGDYDGISSR